MRNRTTRLVCAALPLVVAVASGCDRRDSLASAGAPIPAVGPSPAPSEPDPEAAALRKRLVTHLSGFETVVSRSDLVRLGEGPVIVEQLIAIHNDLSLHKGVRLNALAALGYFPEPAAKAVLEATILDPATTAIFRRPALRAYGLGFKEAAVPVLARFIDHDELHTRNSAVRALVDIGSPAAREALRRRLIDEPEPMIKNSIEAGLRPPR